MTEPITPEALSALTSDQIDAIDEAWRAHARTGRSVAARDTLTAAAGGTPRFAPVRTEQPLPNSVIEAHCWSALAQEHRDTLTPADYDLLTSAWAAGSVPGARGSQVRVPVGARTATFVADEREPMRPVRGPTLVDYIVLCAGWGAIMVAVKYSGFIEWAVSR